MTAKVFISHSSGDQKVAKTICTALEHRGLVCWMASRDVGPGQNYMDAIVHAIRDAKVMVLVFSQNANISSEILKELSLASKYKVNVIPARIEDVVPSEAFELEFATRQWIDLFEDWEREIDRLTSWIISIVAIEPNADGVVKRDETAVLAGSPPTSKPPQTPIVENRSELGKSSDAETSTVQKKKEPLPSDNTTRSPAKPPPEPTQIPERAAHGSTTAESQIHTAPQPESPLATSMKPGAKSASKSIYWGAAFALAIIGLMWGGWVITAEKKARADAAHLEVEAKICAERFMRDAKAKANLIELRRLLSGSDAISSKMVVGRVT